MNRLHVPQQVFLFYFRVFPAAHYVVKINTYPLNSQNLTVTIVMIDTWKLCGGGGWSPSGSQKVKSLWTWIKSTLKKNR